jgi:hypothetical protein
MNRSPNDNSDNFHEDIFTIAKRWVPKRDHEYIRDLENGIKTLADVLKRCRSENLKLRREVGELRERVGGRLAWDEVFEIFWPKEDDCRDTGRMEVPRAAPLMKDWEGHMDDDYVRKIGDFWREGRSAKSNIGLKRDAEWDSMETHRAFEENNESRTREEEHNNCGGREIGGKRISDYQPYYHDERDRQEYETTVRENEQRKTQQPTPRFRSHYRTKLPSVDKRAVWQDQFESPLLQHNGDSWTQSEPWERRETMDGQYYYFINLEDGRMTNPYPILGYESDDCDFLYNTNPPSRLGGKEFRRPHDDITTPSHYVQPHHHEPELSDSRIQSLHHARTRFPNQPKSSKLSPEVDLSNPNISHGHTSATKPSPRTSAQEGTPAKSPILPRPPLGSHVSQDSRPTPPVHKPAPTAKNSPSTHQAGNSKSSPELFPPSPRSYYGYGPPKGKDYKTGNQPHKVANQQRMTNYKPPFVNTVSDVEDKKWKGQKSGKMMGRDELLACTEKEEIVVPIRKGGFKEERVASGKEREKKDRRRGRWIGEVD